MTATEVSTKYRKRPIVVDAFQMTKERFESNEHWPNWLHEAWNKPNGDSVAFFITPGEDMRTTDYAWIFTLEGPHIVSHADWVIRGIKGELHPCKPDIFEMTYETVDS